MKTVGIIAEYNPFHNGHAYHIRKAKERTGADYCIVVMSGDFVQRGANISAPQSLSQMVPILYWNCLPTMRSAVPNTLQAVP